MTGIEIRINGKIAKAERIWGTSGRTIEGIRRDIEEKMRYFEHSVRVWMVRRLLANTPPFNTSSADHWVNGQLRTGADLSQRPIRQERKNILDYIKGPTGQEYNWAYVNEKGDPVRSDYRHDLPLVVPYPGQKRRPNRTVDALQWILQNTRLRYRPNGRTWRQIVNFPRPQVWTTRMSWRNAAKLLSLRAGNFAAGWWAAGEWAAGWGHKNPVEKVLPKNGIYSKRGEASGSGALFAVNHETKQAISNFEVPTGRNFVWITKNVASQLDSVQKAAAEMYEKLLFQ